MLIFLEHFNWLLGVSIQLCHPCTRPLVYTRATNYSMDSKRWKKVFKNLVLLGGQIHHKLPDRPAQKEASLKSHFTFFFTLAFTSCQEGAWTWAERASKYGGRNCFWVVHASVPSKRNHCRPCSRLSVAHPAPYPEQDQPGEKWPRRQTGDLIYEES